MTFPNFVRRLLGLRQPAIDEDARAAGRREMESFMKSHTVDEVQAYYKKRKAIILELDPGSALTKGYIQGFEDALAGRGEA
jgi:hypothetical protein